MSDDSKADPSAQVPNLVLPYHVPWIERLIEDEKKGRSAESLVKLYVKPGADASRMYLVQPTREMLLFDDIMRLVRRALVPVPGLQAAEKFATGDIDPRACPFVDPSPCRLQSGDYYDYSTQGRELWSKQAQALVESWGYVVKRRPDFDGGERDGLYILVDSKKT